MFTGFPVRGGHEEVGLPAEKRRDLDDVKDLGGPFDLACLVDIGQHRNGRSCFTPAGPEPFSSPGPRKERSEVRFALSNDALKMKGTPRSATAFDPPGETERPFRGFDDAGPGDQGRTPLPADLHSALISIFFEAVGIAGSDKRLEKRVRLQGLGFELWMKLAAEEPGMAPDLDDLDQAIIRVLPETNNPASASGFSYSG